MIADKSKGSKMADIKNFKLIQDKLFADLDIDKTKPMTLEE